MVKMGILPKIVVNKKEKDSVNLTWCSLFLGGKLPLNLEELAGGEKGFWKDIERLTDVPILPKQLSKWLKEAIFQTGGACTHFRGRERGNDES